MATVKDRRTDGGTKHATRRQGELSLWHLALLFVSLVSISLVLVGVAVRGSPAWFLIPPMLLGCWAILNLRRR